MKIHPATWPRSPLDPPSERASGYVHGESDQDDALDHRGLLSALQGAVGVSTRRPTMRYTERDMRPIHHSHARQRCARALHDAAQSCQTRARTCREISTTANADYFTIVNWNRRESKECEFSVVLPTHNRSFLTCIFYQVIN